MTTSVTCPGCGSAVPLGDRFCGTCGNPITGSALMSGEAARYDPWLELLQKLRAATIGEYEIRGELGRGGMAAVFLAHDLQLNRRVAIKVMLPGLTYGERMWDRFLAEAQTAAKLDHPHIVYIHSVKEKDRFLYFVMKHIDGCALDDLLAQHRPFPIPVARLILSEVARALDYAHREGVVHRDIKPANIMVDRKGSSIVMDFGIARAVDSQHFTQTGATIGTPAYMSPEQCHGRETSAASDQYSLGILAYELLTGAPPFTGTPIELQISHMQDSPVPIRDRRPELSLELSGAVNRMLEKDPAARWPSLRDLVPIFSRGLDALGDGPREQLVEMVKSSTPQRQSFTATPVSPTPSVPADATLTPYPGRRSSATIPVGSMEGSAAGSETPERDAPTAIAAPGAAGASGVSSVAGGSSAMAEPPEAAEGQGPGFSEGGEPDGGLGQAVGARRLSRRSLVMLSSSVVLVIIVALAVKAGKQEGGTSAAPAAGTLPGAAAGSLATRGAPVVGAPVAPVVHLPGDSVAMGPGTAAAARGRGKAPPRQVTVDAVALLQLSFGARTTIGDTVLARLSASDDSGAPVTSPRIQWTTSNPHVVRFAGPSSLIAVGEGKATITVTAGTTTASRELTVVARKR